VAAFGNPVRISNFTEFYTNLRLISVDLHVELRQGLKDVLETVADDARRWADIRGFTPPGTSGRGTGALIGMIRVGLTSKKGYIVDRASNEGFAYPRMWEYASGGERSFFRPAIKEGETRIYTGVEVVLNEVIRKWNQA
jgi:hypothetical protein